MDGVNIENDLILGGNIYNTEVETPRMDMGTGLIIQNEDNELLPVSSKSVGLDLSGNIKSLAKVYHQGQDRYFVLAGVNNGTVKIYSRDK